MDINNVKSNLKGVVGSCPNGILLQNLTSEYKNITQSRLDFILLGFNSLQGLIESMPDVVRIVNDNGKLYVRISLQKNGSNHLTDLIGLVNATTKKKRFPNRNHSIIQNGNKQCKPTTLSTIAVNCSQKAVVTEENNAAKIEDQCYYSGNSTASNCEDLFDSGSWLVRPHIQFAAVHKQVRVLGVQSGNVIVTGFSASHGGQKIPAMKVVVTLPGNMALWQPPFTDKQRDPGHVDTNTAFPVIILKRVSNTKVQVRVMGLLIVLEVLMSDLYMMPIAGHLSDLIRHIQLRETTIISIEFLPRNTDIWDSVAYPGLYTVLSSIEQDRFILESYDDRGQFLNISLLNYLKTKLVLSGDNEEKRDYWQYMKNCIERSVEVLLPSFEKLVSDQSEVHQEGGPLGVIYDVNDCIDHMLLGSKSLLFKDRGQGPQVRLSSQDGALQRMQHGKAGLTFYCFDDQSSDINVRDQAPLHGIYVLNDRFIKSLAVDSGPLRFRLALLIKIQSLLDIATDLGLGYV